MDSASARLKEDVWQVLGHLLANNLIWIALVLIIGGIAIGLLTPARRWGRDFAISGGIIAVFAIVIHSIAWTPLL